MQSNTSSQAGEQTEDHMHGAAIVDEQGKETPITEDMIQAALQNILQAAQT